MTLAWEKRKLVTYSKATFGGGTPKTTKQEYWNGDLPWLQSSNLTADDVQNVRVDKYISISGVENSAAKIIPAQSIAIVIRVGVGKLTLMRVAYTTSQDFLSLSNLTVDGQFALYNIYSLLKRNSNNIQGTSIKGVTKSELLSKTVCTPTNKLEQHYIGKLLQTLDNLITVNQRKF